MLSSFAPSSSSAPSPPAVSTHFVGESARAVCFLKDATRGGESESSSSNQSSESALPLVAVGGDHALALYLPVVASRDEQALRAELRGGATHSSSSSAVELTGVADVAQDGDVTALRFAGGHANLLFSATAAGSVHVLRVGADRARVLAPLEAPQWHKLFGGASATALDASADRATLVAASARGAVAWLRFDDDAALRAPQVVANGDSSRLPLHGVKMLARESVVATVGAAPGAQLRVWDRDANAQCPVAVAADPHATCALTAIETHPTRPELLITGSDDGRVALWDLRRLDAPFRVEARHQRAVRTLALHATSPRLLFSGSDDATVLAWDFHHQRPASEAVEYEKHVHAHRAGAGLQVQPLARGFLPWRAMDFHAASDTLLAGSDAQSLLLVRHASRAHHALAL